MRFVTALVLLLLAQIPLCVQAQPDEHAPAPSPVVAEPLVKGHIAPSTRFVGTIVFPQVAEVAAEVSGRINRVFFEEGDQLSKGKQLAELDSALLRKEIRALNASRSQSSIETRKARLDAERFRTLFEEKTVSRQEYENYLYAFEGLEQKTASLDAQVQRLEVELAKKKVSAPFSGVVLTRYIEPGEWVNIGSPVAALARNDEVDIRIDVPEEIIPFLKTDMPLAIETSSGPLPGTIIAIIPRGDTKTRTFPVKIRAANTRRLMEGMEAGVRLPSSEKVPCLLVSRDALVTTEGQSMVMVNQNGQAQPMPVTVIGYTGTRMGITGEGLEAGMQVIIKGNERLRPGQEIRLLEESR